MDVLAQEGRCELLYFDESGFSPNPPLQYRWSKLGETRCVEPKSHRQRVNVLGALRHDGKLIWCAQPKSTVRDDVMAFFGRLADMPYKVPRLVVIDKAAIQKDDAMEKKRRQWVKKGLHL